MRNRWFGFVVLLAWCLHATQSPAGIPVTVTDFLATHCLDCHQGDDPSGGLTFASLSFDADHTELWQRIALQLATFNMPPPDQEVLEVGEVHVALQEVRRRMLQAGMDWDLDYRLAQPAHANLLNHRRLFDGSVTGPAYGPPRLWRIHPQAYDRFLEGFGNQLKKGGPLAKPFLLGDGKGQPGNYAALMQADGATLSQLILNCRRIADYQTKGFAREEFDRKRQETVVRIYRKCPPAFTAILDSEGKPDASMLVAAVTEEFEIVLRRPPRDDERQRFIALVQEAMEIAGKEQGLHTLAMAVLMRPESIYRMEVGLGKTDASGRRQLAPYELAHAIAYALTDTPPDRLLLGAAKPRDRNHRPTEPSLLGVATSGALASREDVRRVALQIWDHPGIEKTNRLRFFQEFFGYHRAESVFKGDRAGREFVPRFLVQDADMLVEHIVAEDKDVLRQLLTTEDFFVQWPGSTELYDKRIHYITGRIKPDNKRDRNYDYFVRRTAEGLRPMPQANPTWRRTVRFYNLHEQTWDYPLTQPFALPAGQRKGLLTHPAWLIAWSGNSENDPIRRGKWIREHLLAGSVPDVPITVDAAVPQDPHQTLRERLRVTRDAYCWQCHRKMEPLGLPFEAYTDFGRYREREGLGPTKALQDPQQTSPTRTTGEVLDSGEEALDGRVTDVHALMERLAGSPRVRQSFVRHAFRFFLGRNERIHDSPTLIAADRAYVEAGGSFKALVIELLCSDSFLFRKTPPSYDPR